MLGKYEADVFNVNDTKAKYGGKQKMLRDSIITKGWLYRVKRSTAFMECLQRALRRRQGTFVTGDPPPFHAWSAPPADTLGMAVPDRRGKGKRPSGQEASSDDAGGEDKDREGTMVEGYVGKGKGMKQRQLLWEGGWLVAAVSRGQKLPPQLNLEKVHSEQPDSHN